MVNQSVGDEPSTYTSFSPGFQASKCHAESLPWMETSLWRRTAALGEVGGFVAIGRSQRPGGIRPLISINVIYVITQGVTHLQHLSF